MAKSMTMMMRQASGEEREEVIKSPASLSYCHLAPQTSSHKKARTDFLREEEGNERRKEVVAARRANMSAEFESEIGHMISLSL